MYELVTDEGVTRVGSDGVLEFFRDLDGRSVSRLLLWGCDATITNAGSRDLVTLTITRKRLPVLSLQIPVEERGAAERFAAAVRSATSAGGAAAPAP